MTHGELKEIIRKIDEAVNRGADRVTLRPHQAEQANRILRWYYECYERDGLHQQFYTWFRENG